MAKCAIRDNMLMTKNGIELPLNALRLCYLYSESLSSWWGIGSTSSLTYLDLNSKDKTQTNELCDILLKTAKELQHKPRKLKSLEFALSDYQGNSYMLKLSELKGQAGQFIELLQQYYGERVDLLENWMKTENEIVLRGGFGKQAILRKDGVHIGKKKHIAWREIEQIQLQEQESLVTISSILFIPHGVSTGTFGFKKFKYALKSVPQAKKNLYMAECMFWLERMRDTSEVAGEPTSFQI